MSAQTAGLVVQIAGIYLALGALFALAFVTRGAARVDPDAREASWGFRAVVFPGVTALWPLLALRWARGAASPPGERNAHRDAAAARVHGDAAVGRAQADATATPSPGDPDAERDT